MALVVVGMIEGLDRLLEGSGQPGLTELRSLLRELWVGPDAPARLTGQQRMRHCAYRLHFEANGGSRSVVVKRLEPRLAQRNELVAKRWLPAVGLGQTAPALLGVAAERSGQGVWHVSQDLGDWTLAEVHPDRERVEAAVELIAQLHIRFARHALLAECRLHGGDLGIYFYTANVRDAIASLEALRPPAVELPSERQALRNRLLERMHKLLDEQPYRAQVMAEFGGPDTLLHGDLWTTNTLVIITTDGLQARLIDWDHAAVGPVSYDLSTFLYRFPTQDRQWILDSYRQSMASAGWRLPATRELNLLFDTAECARIANRVIWPALALLEGGNEWAFDELAAAEQWFEQLQPVLR